MKYKLCLILIVILIKGSFAQDTVRYIGIRGKGRTISFKGVDYSIQLYKKGKRAGVSERTMYFDKDYYRFQFLGGGVTKLLRADKIVGTRKGDSVFVDGRVYTMSYDKKYHAYDFKRDTSMVLTCQYWKNDSSDYNDAYDIDVTFYDVSQDARLLQIFGFETVSRHIKASGISPPVAIIMCSVLTGGVIAWIKSKSGEDDTL
jgi:hypothetical protein